MRLNRRQILGCGAGITMLPLAASSAHSSLTRPVPIDVRAIAIKHFSPRDPDRTRFGALNFRSGLHLSAKHDDFGGLSGLWRSADGKNIVAVSDAGSWLTADLLTENGRLSGLGKAQIAPILGADGRPLWRTRSYDCEGLSIINGVAHVSIERTHEVLRFDWAKDGVLAKGRPIPVPREVKLLPSNKGLEAIGIIPAPHPLAGAVIAIAERSGGEDETLGVILGGPKPGMFKVKRRNSFDVTDLAFLPSGDMLILERWFASLRGLSIRIRRIDAHSIRAGALLDGDVLLEADLGEEIDNMEGLAVHDEAGRTILTLISDDNFWAIQRTLLLEFELV